MALVTAATVGPQEEVLVVAVTLADVDAAHAPWPVFPSTPDILRCCLFPAAAFAEVVGGYGEDLGEFAASVAGKCCFKIPWTAATGSISLSGRNCCGGKGGGSGGDGGSDG